LLDKQVLLAVSVREEYLAEFLVGGEG